MLNTVGNSILHPETVYLRDREYVNNIDNFVEQMQFLDINNYLLDDILTKVDRASMAYGLEAREPLLDHRIVEFSWQLPMNLKIRNQDQKWILKQILAKYLPKDLIDRPKMGFGVPIDSWIRKDLRELTLDLLSPKKLDSQGFFDSKVVNNRLQQHLSGKQNYQHDLWGVLMFQLWYEKYFCSEAIQKIKLI
jgi:asparagine synthase (glutamine-hydrolysing)